MQKTIKECYEEYMDYCKSIGQREGTLNSKSNKVDDTPFLEINILDLNDMQILELKKFSKDSASFLVKIIYINICNVTYIHSYRL